MRADVPGPGVADHQSLLTPHRLPLPGKRQDPSRCARRLRRSRPRSRCRQSQNRCRARDRRMPHRPQRRYHEWFDPLRMDQVLVVPNRSLPGGSRINSSTRESSESLLGAARSRMAHSSCQQVRLCIAGDISGDQRVSQAIEVFSTEDAGLERLRDVDEREKRGSTKDYTDRPRWSPRIVEAIRLRGSSGLIRETNGCEGRALDTACERTELL